MIFYPENASRSSTIAKNRQAKAEAVLGKSIVARIIGFALFLLGFKRDEISNMVDIRTNTFLSFLTRINKVGVDALKDRRKNSAPVVNGETSPAYISHLDGKTLIGFGENSQQMVLTTSNPMQCRVLALTLANNNMLTWQQAAEVLGSSSSEYVRTLGNKLDRGDVEAVLDHRAGQVKDYRMGEQEKGELVVQWAANVATGRRSSSRALAEDLHRNSGLKLPDRTIRQHMKKLGLVGMDNALRERIQAVKKNC